MAVKIAWVAVFLSACISEHSSAQAPARSWGYVAWWMPDGWRNTDLAAFERLLFFEAKVTPLGRIEQTNGWPSQWGALVNAAQFAQIPIDVTITLLDAPSFHSVFSNEDRMQSLLADTVALARAEASGGIHLDMEVYDDIDDATWARYQAWVIRLAGELATLQPQKQLSAFIPIGGKRQLYGSEALQRMHSVVVQGYDAHWQESRLAGPIAPLDGPYAMTWNAGMRQMDRLGVPRHKQLFSFPLYGYEWQVTPSKGASKVLAKGATTTFATLEGPLSGIAPLSVEERVSAHGAHFDPTSASSYYRFQDKSGRWFEGWFEDWWSLLQKTRFVHKEQLGGIAFFVLGYDRGQLVNALHRQRQEAAQNAAK